MQNTNTNTDRATIAARLDAIIADFCQIHLDTRDRAMSAEERAEVDALADEMSSLRQQLAAAAPAIETEPTAPAIEKEATEKYNGWANYETWAVHLWLSNEPYTDEQARQIVAAAWHNAADEVAADRDAIVTPRVDAADALKEWLRYEENPLTESASLYSDLLGAALDTVDWLEVAEAFEPDPLPSIEPAPEDPEDEDDEQPEEPEAEWRPWSRERED